MQILNSLWNTDWVQIVDKSVNFQLVRSMDKTQVEESFSYIYSATE